MLTDELPLLLLGQGGGAGGVRGGGGGGGRGRGRGRGGRDNQLLGKTIRITRGPYKGTEIIIYSFIYTEISEGLVFHGRQVCKDIFTVYVLLIIKLNTLFP